MLGIFPKIMKQTFLEHKYSFDISMNHIQYENNNINISFCQFWTICFSTAVTSIHLFKNCSIKGEINYPNSKRHLHIQRLYNIFPALLFWDKVMHMISWAKLCQTARYSPSSILNMMKPKNWGLSWAGPSLASAGTGYWNLSLKVLGRHLRNRSKSGKNVCKMVVS